MAKRKNNTRLAQIRNTKRVELNNSKDKTNIEDIADPSHAEFLQGTRIPDISEENDMLTVQITGQKKNTPRKGLDLSIWKGMRIHDRAHGKKSGWTNISFNKQTAQASKSPDRCIWEVPRKD